MKIIGIVGARPNFMKIDPVFRALKCKTQQFSTKLIHTGQHYDFRMSKIFFRDLELQPPDIYLNVGSGTHAEQTGTIMIRLEKVLIKYKPDLVVVVGDVNSTMAATITATKLDIPVAHVEAGLRSFDRRMPEEINRIVTDSLSKYLFTPSKDANDNLIHEGNPETHIYFVGNVMIDTLRHCLKLAKKSNIFESLNVKKRKYVLITLHRPSNVDDYQVLEEILDAISVIQEAIPIFFPIHPRTEKQLQKFGLQSKISAMPNLRIIPPLGYIDFLALEACSKMVFTDSGGIQEETTALSIPCLTLRETTERPITVTQGTNQIVGHNKDKIVTVAHAILDGQIPKGNIPELWDGHTAERIVRILQKRLG